MCFRPRRTACRYGVDNGLLDATGDTATLDLSAAGRALLPERFAPKTTTLNAGSSPDHAGPDTIVIKLAQDWFRGDAQFQVLVDGRPVGNPIAASALADQNDPDTLILRGNFSAASKVQIRFLNDLDLGGPHTDRNLHVLSATANRVPVGIDDTFLDATGETATLDLSPARLALADPTWFGFTFVTPASGARTAGVVRVFENGAHRRPSDGARSEPDDDRAGGRRLRRLDAVRLRLPADGVPPQQADRPASSCRGSCSKAIPASARAGPTCCGGTSAWT
ncbi:MAG: carbohydrate-binding domain-containing protein [Acetobacteraceae bacterium]|nr:carbohydrate-binding domain-containing protein [Acetobacteraceae bacterium]